MIFDEIIGLDVVPKGEFIINREAVRAIILNSEKQLVMIKSKIGDYSFPGGGVDNGESQLETLKREAMEEAGVVIDDCTQLVGTVTEQRRSQEVEDAYFVMKSTYYLCYASEYTEPKLEDYEKEWGFTPVAVEICEAYEKNLDILKHHVQCPSWVQREVFVLKSLLAHQEELFKIGSV